jgi:trk system potassium uptake protein TrkA
MKKSFAILGLGRFGLQLVEELSHSKADVIALDSNEENVTRAGEMIDNAFVCDITNEAALKELGVNNVDHAIIAIGSNLHASILTTVILKEFGIKKITVRVDDEYYVNVLKKLGATDVVSPQKLAGIRVANKVISDTFTDYYEISSDYCIVEITIKKDIKEMSINDLNPRNEFDVNLLLIKRNNTVISPKADDIIKPDDNIIVFGTRAKISAFDMFINTQINK